MHLTFHKLYGISNIIVWDKQKNKPQKQKKQKKVSYIGASAEKEDDDSRQTDAFSIAYPQSVIHLVFLSVSFPFTVMQVISE